MMSPAREWKLGNDATRVDISGDFPVEVSLLNEHTLYHVTTHRQSNKTWCRIQELAKILRCPITDQSNIIFGGARSIRNLIATHAIQMESLELQKRSEFRHRNSDLFQFLGSFWSNNGFQA